MITPEDLEKLRREIEERHRDLEERYKGHPQLIEALKSGCIGWGSPPVKFHLGTDQNEYRAKEDKP